MMRYLTCKEADGWNVRMAETEADDLQSTARAICADIGGMASFPFTCQGVDYTVFYDDEIFTKDKKEIVVSLYVQGDTERSYLDPEGPDLVFGNFALVKGHTHEGMLATLDDEDIKKLSNFIIESDAKLKAMMKNKLFQKNEVIRSRVIKQERNA
jgi:hypothetical protein